MSRKDPVELVEIPWKTILGQPELLKEVYRMTKLRPVAGTLGDGHGGACFLGAISSLTGGTPIDMEPKTSFTITRGFDDGFLGVHPRDTAPLYTRAFVAGRAMSKWKREGCK